MSAEQAERIIKTEEYCITSLSNNVNHAMQCGVRASEQATNIIAIASTVAAALEKGDMSKGLLISVNNAQKDIAKKHLVREYIVSGDDIIIRQFLSDCPHVNQVATVPAYDKPTYH